jgi:GNAT superfamily N-acetyltransferase
MADRFTSTGDPPPGVGPRAAFPPAGPLAAEYAQLDAALRAQPRTIQLFLETQGRQLAQAIVDNHPQIRFTLPDQVVVESDVELPGELSRIPSEDREVVALGLMDRVTRTDSRTALRQRLLELEQSPNPAIAVSARLIQHTTASTMVRSMLPAGRSVTYRAAEGESIPSIPVADPDQPASALTAATDAIALDVGVEEGRGDLLVPYVPSARRFFLPQWVAFDDEDRLLVGSVSEAEAHIASMQAYLGVLHAAVGLAPHLVADPEYQRKRYGMLGQLVNQGRALARYTTREIIETVKRRAASQELNRGLSLSLPYFDDQDLELKSRDFVVIPAGRIMFVPAFVVRAAREEMAKVAQDTRLDPATRKHLLAELHLLQEAFATSRTSGTDPDAPNR